MALKCIILENHADQAVRHAAVQDAVRAYLQNDNVTVEYSEKGRPSVVGASTPKHISVTTTGEKMLVVLNDTPIGIDGEYLPKYAEKKMDFAALAERFLSSEEAEYVRDGSDVIEERERFLKIWTRKEAYVKCVGKSLADFPSFSVVEGDKLLPKLGSTTLRKFSISFAGSEDYLFAIAGV